MSYEDEGVFIRSRFNSEWAGRTQVAYPNVPFSKPNAAWVRLGVNGSGADAVSVGDPDAIRYRHDGMVIVEVFTPVQSGDGESRELCDAAAAVFRGVKDAATKLRFRAPYRIEVGVVDGWFKADVLCPFERDTIY